MAGRPALQMARKKKAFLDQFTLMANITAACEATDVSRRTVYRWQEEDEQFMLAFNEANAIATERLEAEAWKRATDGTRKPVYQGGALVGYVDEKSDTLLIFMLKARNPAKYRDKYDGPPDGQQPFKVADREAYEAL